MLLLSLAAIVPAVATLYFAVFWLGFELWRRHPVLTYTMMLGTFGGAIAAAYVWRAPLLEHQLATPTWVVAIGWVIVGAAWLLGIIADRQLGIRVRSFMPFFDTDGRIALVTTGAYGIVRHPIYAAGLIYQLGMFLVTGYVSIAAAALTFGVGAIWFTRQEERRLVALLEDPKAYDRYRARVPALLPWPR
jgi:protein-S-isoprenylcysteine O-methyltransferase Ste14